MKGTVSMAQFLMHLCNISRANSDPPEEKLFTTEEIDIR